MAAPPGKPSAPPAAAARGSADGDGEDDPRQLAAQFELVQRELQKVDRRLAALEEAMLEAQQAAAAVKHLGEAKAKQDILLPIGAGVHVSAHVDAAPALLMPLGAGYFTQGMPGNVADALDARAQSIARQFQDATQDAERLAQVAAAINERLLQLQGES